MENLPLSLKESMGYVDAWVEFRLYTGHEESLGWPRDCFFVCLCFALCRSSVPAFFLSGHRRLHTLNLDSYHCRRHHPLYLSSSIRTRIQKAWPELDCFNGLCGFVFDLARDSLRGESFRSGQSHGIDYRKSGSRYCSREEHSAFA